MAVITIAKIKWFHEYPIKKNSIEHSKCEKNVVIFTIIIIINTVQLAFCFKMR